jgi:hypothetical protein
MINKEQIKKIGLYVFSGIGILAILLAIFLFGKSTFPPFSSIKTSNNLSYDEGYFSDSVSEGTAMTPTANYKNRNQIKSSAVANNAVLQNNETMDRKITKNGELELLVKNAEITAQDITKKTNELNGFIQNVNIREVQEGVKSGTITIKVPADAFEQAIADFKTFGIKVEREAINSDDITEQYIDIEAQLKNYRAEEQGYLEVMKRAYTVEDILKVSQYLSNIRGQIDRLEGQIKYLNRQIEMSQIIVYLTAEAEVEIFGLRWRPLYEIQKSFRNLMSGLQVYINAIISFVFFLPVLLIWLTTLTFLIWLIAKIIKWLHKRKNSHNKILNQ